MKHLHFTFPLLLFYFMVGCSGPESTTDSPSVFSTFQNHAKKSEAKTYHEDGWTIVSTTEKGDHVFWFLAPDVDKVSPAVFKKTIHVMNTNEQETKIISQCDAPKQQCDELMKQFKLLSEKYK